jgi:PKD repeat protein
MLGRMHKLKTIVVTIAMVLTAFFVMASDITKDEVTACAGNDQEVDVGVAVQFDGTCSKGVGTLNYKWFFGDGEVANGAKPTHTYEGTTAGRTADEEGIYYATLVVKDSNNVYGLDTVRITVKNHYPTADAGSDVAVNEDETVFFDPSGSSDVDNDIKAVNWDFGDGTDKDTNMNTIMGHVYEKAGKYPVTLTITDNDGAFDEDIIFVTVKNLKPTADGVANSDTDDDITINEDDTVSFDASGSSDTSSDKPSLQYGWDMGDGSKTKGKTTTHTYTKKGTYTVTLTVTDDDGELDKDTMMIRVLNSAPVANAGPDQSVDEGDTVFFDAAGTSDTLSDEPILDYSWSLGNKGTQPTNNWYDNSMNNVDLVVTDDDGLQDMDSLTVAVNNVPPVSGIDDIYVLVDFTIRASGEKWHNVLITLSEPNLETPVVEVLRTPGSPNDQSRTAEDVRVNIAEDVIATVYYTPWDDPVNGSPNGATPVWFTLTFEDGSSYTHFRSFNVQKPDEWNWTHDMNSYILGQPIHFEGSIYDPGTDDILVQWDFGDGSAPIINNYVSNGVHPMMIHEHHVHTFPNGIFTVRLDATDDDGGLGTMSVIITHTDRLKSTNVAPKTASSGGKTVFEDEGFTLIGTGNDTGSDLLILTYKWYLGDGTAANTPNVVHSYAKAGTYYPTLVVEDDEGAIGITSELVKVLNVVPTAVANADQLNVSEDDVINFDAYSSTDTPTDLSILEYAWDYGDGSKGYGIATTHVYSKKGTYQVTLTATDDNGASSTSTLTIKVDNKAPYDLKITADATADEDEIIFFKGTVKDTPSDFPLLKYSWKFGDGSTGTGMNPTHAYALLGQYTVKMTLTDDDSASSDMLFYIIVQNVAPVAYGGLSTNLYGPKMSVKFNSRGFDTHSDQSSLTYQWKFGDGSTSNWPSPSHQYSTDGSKSYTASLTVKDKHGASDTHYVTVNVKVDTDGDQLLDAEEKKLGTDPKDYDSDDDWLIDYYELNPPWGKPKTDPTKSDQDRDGCSDWEEIWPGRDGYITDPKDPDMDNDNLEDCDESYAKTYKSTKRLSIGDPSNGYGSVDISLSDIKSSSPISQIITAEAKVGISHTKIGEVKITLKNGATTKVLRDKDSNTSKNLFISYDLLSKGFPATDFTSSRKWTLTVEDTVKGNPKGYVEYFEIYILTALNPNDKDTDNDGLSDGEESSLGDDGWKTDPWKSDTDGDGISDDLEANGWKRTTSNSIYKATGGFKTDPTRKDTDRDKANDKADWDPLNNLMVEVDIGKLTLHDEDGWGEGDAQELFFGISVGIDSFDKGKSLWTDRQSVDVHQTKDMNRQYTFKVDDSKRNHKVILTAWDQDGGSDDDYMDFMPGYAAAWGNYFDLIQGSPNDATDDKKCYKGSGNGDGYDTDVDITLEWCISTVRPQRIKTILLNSTDSESLYKAKDGKYRYVGEAEYYIVTLDVTDSSSSVFSKGFNVIIVPRSVFVNSSLNAIINSSNQPSYVKNMAFSANDKTKKQTSGSIVGTLRAKVSGAIAETILWHLKHNKSYSVIAQSREVTNELMTLNLDDYVLDLIPLKPVEFDGTGKKARTFWQKIGDVIASVFEAIGDILMSIFDLFVRIGKALVEIGMWIIDKIISAISAVIDAIIFIVEILIDFIVGLVEWVVDLIVNELLPLLKSAVIFVLKTFGGPVFEWLAREVFGRAFDALGSVLSWVAKDFLPGVADVVKGALSVGAAIGDVLRGLDECLGELTLAAFGDEIDGECRAIVDALEKAGKSFDEMFKAALKIGGSALATVATIFLDSCGVLGGARGLNASEKAEAKKVFGSSINLGKVKIADATPCTAFVSWIHSFSNEYRPFTMGYVITVTDKNVSGTMKNYTLIHELTHVWQYEQKGMYNYGYKNNNNGSGGESELNNASGDFSKFNVEQQAKIIEHYFVRRYIQGLSKAEYAAWQPYADIVHEP